MKARVSRPSDLKTENKAAILKYVYQNDVTTKSDIAKNLGISKPTASGIVDELVDEKWVKVAGIGESTTRGGKPPVLLRFNPVIGSVIGLHISEGELNGALFDLEMNVLHTKRQRYRRSDDIPDVLHSIHSVIRDLIDYSKVLNIRLFGIGISAPGVIEARTGTIVKSANFEEWNDIPLGARVSAEFDLPVRVDNEARNSAVAEQWFGQGRNLQTFITLRTKGGIGTGLVVNGQVYEGLDDSAGEFGHTTIDMNGPVCKCGNHGCWEVYASEKAFLRRFTEALLSNRPSSLKSLIEKCDNGGELDIADLAPWYLRRDPFVQEKINQHAFYIGVGVANLVNLFNPERVLLDGQLTVFEDGFIEEITRVVKERALSLPANRVVLSYSSFEDEIALVGAGALMVRDLIEGGFIMEKSLTSV